MNKSSQQTFHNSDLQTIAILRSQSEFTETIQITVTIRIFQFKPFFVWYSDRFDLVSSNTQIFHGPISRSRFKSQFYFKQTVHYSDHSRSKEVLFSRLITVLFQTDHSKYSLIQQIIQNLNILLHVQYSDHFDQVFLTDTHNSSTKSVFK